MMDVIHGGSDEFLRRIERTAIAVCLAMSVISVIVTGGRLGPAVAVLAGGLLIGVSYWTIGLGVHALFVPASERSTDESGAAAPPRKVTWTFARVILRYALLGLLAYVMIGRLRLHPIGLLAGASSVVAAASIEAGRLLLKKSRN
jgi:hypothetical protein